MGSEQVGRVSSHARTVTILLSAPSAAKHAVLVFHCVSSSARRPTEFTCGEVCEDVLVMNRLAKGRRAKRYQSGALSLNTPKLSFKLDENGNPAEFQSYPVRDSNRLVEVCSGSMLRSAAYVSIFNIS